MTEANHSVPDDMLMGYASGSLAKAFDLVLATHVSLNDDARARLETFEALGGAILCDMDTDAVDVTDESLAQTMEKIRGSAPIERPAPSEGLFPTPLQSIVGGDADAVRWRSVGGGVKQCVLHSDEGGTVRLLSIAAGRTMARK